mgnify:CR=1 FL=1
MHLIQDHVFEFLIINRTKECVHILWLSCLSVGEVVFPAVAEAVLDECLTDVVDLKGVDW